MIMEKTCVKCGKTFETAPKFINYCSEYCKFSNPHSEETKQKIVEKLRARNGMSLQQIPCEWCQTTFEVWKSPRTRVYEKRFCSKACANHARAKLKEPKPIPDHKCKICDKQFTCGMELGGHQQYHRFDFNDLKKDATRRERLKRERGHQCEVCQLTEWCGKPIPIELDHIDGNPENNVKDNLRLICPNCHAQTDTYKGRNVGKVLNTKRSGVLKKHYAKYR